MELLHHIPNYRFFFHFSMSKKFKPDELIDAIVEPRVAEAIAKALAPFVNKTVGDTLATGLQDLIADIAQLKDENSQLRARIMDQDLRIDELEAYSRSDNLIVRGLPEQSSAERASASGGTHTVSHLGSVQSVESTFIAFCKDSLNVVVQPSDISIAHRLKAGPKDSVRPTLVRFTTRKARNEVYGAKRMLKGSAKTIFISEHLTKSAAELFYMARKLLRERKIHATWTQNGQVFVKFSSDPNDRAALIRVKKDLNLKP